MNRIFAEFIFVVFIYKQQKETFQYNCHLVFTTV